MTFAENAFSRLRCCTGDKSAVHDDEADLLGADEFGDLFDLALAEETRRTDLGKRYDFGGDDVEIDRGGEPARFVDAGLGRAPHEGGPRMRFRSGPLRFSRTWRRSFTEVGADDQRPRARAIAWPGLCPKLGRCPAV